MRRPRPIAVARAFFALAALLLAPSPAGALVLGGPALHEPFADPWRPVLGAWDPSTRNMAFGFSFGMRAIGLDEDPGHADAADPGGTGLHARYAQRSFWIIDNNAAGIGVTTDFRPELALQLQGGDVRRAWGAWPEGLDARLAFIHESNGLQGPESRGWNRVAFTLRAGSPKRNTVSAEIALWKAFRVENSNEDLRRYAGDGEIILNVRPPHPRGATPPWSLRLDSRYGFDTYDGAPFTWLEASLVVEPFFLEWIKLAGSSSGLHLLLQAVVGRGEFLQDYRSTHDRVGVGIAIAR